MVRICSCNYGATKTHNFNLERTRVVAPKVLSIPIMSDQKCKKERSEAAAKGRLCTAQKDEKDMCSVCVKIIFSSLNQNKLIVHLRYKKEVHWQSRRQEAGIYLALSLATALMREILELHVCPNTLIGSPKNLVS
jgi:hypothetical protein